MTKHAALLPSLALDLCEIISSKDQKFTLVREPETFFEDLSK